MAGLKAFLGMSNLKGLRKHHLAVNPRPAEIVHDGRIGSVGREVLCPSPVRVGVTEVEGEVAIPEDLAGVEGPHPSVKDLAEVLGNLAGTMFCFDAREVHNDG